MLLSLSLTAGLPAVAETVTVNGARGVSGDNGDVGSPGLPGTDGQAGETAIAVADAPDENNFATATGGSGGQGGSGGAAETSSGADGGGGGSGGRGGDAIAEATTLSGTEINATARGGSGGFRGPGGRGDSPGISGSPGMFGGDGGDATATAEILTELGSEPPFFGQDGFSIANGGHSTGTGASGGSAYALLIGTVTGGDESQSATHSLSAIATGGRAGFQGDTVEARGGNATAEISASTTHGALIVVADARGGNGPGHDPGISPGATGDASAVATGTHSGVGTLSVRAFASPRSGENPGTAQATASGFATNGADVIVEATVSGGNGIELRDAVSGSTSGSLELIQRAQNVLSGANTVTSLVASNPGGGDVIARVTAGGGIGLREGGAGGDGIIENVELTGSRDVTIIGTAVGGQGGQSSSAEIPLGTGGGARVVSMMGRSTGNGAVLVEATARSGAGGTSGSFDPSEAIGDAGIVALDNAVDGETTGELTLRQIAISGNAIIGQPSRFPGREASSRIDRTRSADHFTIHSEALGAVAEAFGSATNTSGAVSVEVVAAGTSGAGPAGITGGEARATAFGATRLDDREVMVGADSLVNARGGIGIFDSNFEVLGDGGVANSQSTGVAEGDSRVFVWDRAVGGEGGTDFFSGFPPVNDHVGANGGTATSRANATNSGLADVLANARAIGGMGGNARGEGQSSGRGGDATASASGESLGGADVVARAQAIGGRGGYRLNDSLAGRGGDASVTDLSGSTTGRLTLEAIAVGGPGGADSIVNSTSFGRGGDAHVSVDATNEGGGDLFIEAEGRATRGGRVTLGTIRGTSANGAEVSVSATVDLVRDFSLEPIPDDEPIQLLSYVDAVTGETSGVLRLRQDIDGGREGGSVENEVNDVGNRVGLAIETETRARDGADAIARSNATNMQGWATGDAHARSDLGRQATAEVDVFGAGDVDSVATASSDVGTSVGAEFSRSVARARNAGDGGTFADATSEAAGGADSLSTAEAHGNGMGAVVAEANARTSGEGGGQIEAIARGVSDGAANVSVLANVRRAENSTSVVETVMRDSVSGSTAGELNLSQTILSFNGDARSSLNAQNEGGGALIINLSAFSTSTSTSTGVTAGGDAILGDIIGESNTAADVQVDVTAIGQRVRMESLDSPSGGSEIRGSSNGGDVSVRAGFAASGKSETTISPTELRGGDGNSIAMEQVVDGETSGRLTLIQESTGAAGVNVSISFSQRDLLGVGGRGGDALNRLEKIGRAEVLRLEGVAVGGRGGNLSRAQQGEAGRGGDAELSLLGVNETGSIELLGSSRGGAGGRSETNANDGGAAMAAFNAQSWADGQAVIVGRESTTPDGSFGAIGGVGGAVTRSFSFPQPTETHAGDGGSAVSRSEGRALGDSRVDVFDQALGGVGGLGSPSRFSPLLASGGQGGSALSVAVAQGAGQSRVVGKANAYGGSAGSRLLTGARGGDADAFAHVTGLGEVQASALAVGGNTSTEHEFGGSGHSRVEAFGNSGSALADARTGTGSLGSLRAAVTRDLRQSLVIEASAASSLSILPPLQVVDASASIVGGLSSDAFLAATDVKGSLEAILTERPAAEVKALGQWQGRANNFDDVVQITELDITLAAPDPNADLVLAVFDLQGVGGGFDELSFRLEVFGEQFGEEAVFDDIESAQMYFASPIVLGNAYLEDFGIGDTPAVRAIFEVSMSGEQAISVRIAAIVVPEPSTAMLLGLGLIVIARRRPVGLHRSD